MWFRKVQRTFPLGSCRTNGLSTSPNPRVTWVGTSQSHCPILGSNIIDRNPGFSYLTVGDPSVAIIGTFGRDDDVLSIMKFGVRSKNRAVLESCGARIGTPTHVARFRRACKLHLE